MMKRNPFILDNYIANTVPNFYFIDNKTFIVFTLLKMCMIFRHRCQGIIHIGYGSMADGSYFKEKKSIKTYNNIYITICYIDS